MSKNIEYLIPAKLDEVTINSSFWSGIMETVRTKVIPYQWEAFNDRIEGAAPSFCINNFKLAAKITKYAAEGKKYEPAQDEKYGGFVFQDSDFAKWIEAVGYSLMNHKDEELEKTADEAIDIICRCSQPDGYLNSYYIIHGLDKRFTNLRDNHELYCLGHLIEGAISYYQATGKRKLLDAVIKYADLVDRTFGPEPEKLKGYPGHEILEMALVRLYQVTKEERYLKLAKYFVDQRGQQPLYFIEEAERENRSTDYYGNSYFKYQYSQAGKPVRDQKVAEGHAVRAVYLYSGMADVARLTKDTGLMAVCEELWNDIAKKQMYITGGIGATSFGEAFTYDYDLPNDTNYAETCASIGLLFFTYRMLISNPDSKYADVMEKVLYNGILSGMSLDGTKFFYVNPLEAIPEASEKDPWHRHVHIERQKWFGCACCPPNLARTLSSLGQYAFSRTDNKIFINLFISGSYNIKIGENNVTLKLQTEYPWKSSVAIDVLIDNKAVPEQPEDNEFTLAIRIPGWCRKYSFSCGGRKTAADIKNGYAYICRNWKSGDQIILEMDMPVEIISANPKVREDIGKVAVMRGPVVYCLEEADNGKDLHRIYLNTRTNFTESYDSNLLGGIVKLQSNGFILDDSAWNDDALYQPEKDPVYISKPLTWIPYYSWANRTPGEMRVWVNKKM